jgi:hypothetical protein
MAASTISAPTPFEARADRIGYQARSGRFLLKIDA